MAADDEGGRARLGNQADADAEDRRIGDREKERLDEGNPAQPEFKRKNGHIEEAAEKGDDDEVLDAEGRDCPAGYRQE